MNGKKQSVQKYTILVKDGIMLCWKLFRKHKYNMQQVSHRHKDMAPKPYRQLVLLNDKTQVVGCR